MKFRRLLLYNDVREIVTAYLVVPDLLALAPASRESAELVWQVLVHPWHFDPHINDLPRPKVARRLVCASYVARSLSQSALAEAQFWSQRW